MHISRTFKVQIETAVVKVYRSYHRRTAITQALLRMVETALVFIHLDAHSQQILVVRTGYTADIFLIRYLRRYYPDVHSRLCRKVKDCQHLVVGDEIGCGNVYIFLGVVYHVHINKLAHVFGVQRRVAVGDDKALGIVSGTGNTVTLIIVIRSRDNVPHMQKHNSEVPYAVALQHNGRVLPVAETVNTVYILVRYIYSAVEGHLAVDDKYLSVVTVVLDGRKERTEAVEYHTLDTLLDKLLLIHERQEELGAHPVIDKPYLDAFRDLVQEYLQYLLPHLAVVDDEVFHEDEALGFFELSYHRLELILARGEVSHPCVRTGRETTVVVNIACQLIPLGRIVPYILHKGTVGL